MKNVLKKELLKESKRAVTRIIGFTMGIMAIACGVFVCFISENSVVNFSGGVTVIIGLFIIKGIGYMEKEWEIEDETEKKKK